jgi:putative membrane protein
VGNLADFLAAERTFLAWIRTSLALAGFGFVIARFGLFLEAMRVGPARAGVAETGSAWIGASLILAGSFVFAWSAWSYSRLIRKLKSGEPEPAGGSAVAVAAAIILAMLGIALAAHLLSISRTQPAKELSLSPNNGIVTIPSHHPVKQTVRRLQDLLQPRRSICRSRS